MVLDTVYVVNSAKMKNVEKCTTNSRKFVGLLIYVSKNIILKLFEPIQINLLQASSMRIARFPGSARLPTLLSMPLY